MVDISEVFDLISLARYQWNRISTFAALILMATIDFPKKELFSIFEEYSGHEQTRYSFRNFTVVGLVLWYLFWLAMLSLDQVYWARGDPLHPSSSDDVVRIFWWGTLHLYWPYGYGPLYWFTILMMYSIFQLIVSYGNKKISHRRHLLLVFFYSLPLLGLTGLFLFIHLWHGGLMPISSVYEIVVSGEWSEFFDVLSTTQFLSGIALIIVAFTSRKGKHLGILTFADSIVGIINAALLHIVLDMGSYYRIVIVPMPGAIMMSLLLLGLFIGGVYQLSARMNISDS